MARHVWKHLSEDHGIKPLSCVVGGCHYKTYLKRSLDSHYSSHQRGKTTEHFGAVDHRDRYRKHFDRCLFDCFGRDHHPSTNNNAMEMGNNNADDNDHHLDVVHAGQGMYV